MYFFEVHLTAVYLTAVHLTALHLAAVYLYMGGVRIIRLPWTAQYLIHFSKLFYNCILLHCTLIWSTLDCSAPNFCVLECIVHKYTHIVQCSHTSWNYFKLMSLQCTLLLDCSALDCSAFDCSALDCSAPCSWVPNYLTQFKLTAFNLTATHTNLQAKRTFMNYMDDL